MKVSITVYCPYCSRGLSLWAEKEKDVYHYILPRHKTYPRDVDPHAPECAGSYMEGQTRHPSQVHNAGD